MPLKISLADTEDYETLEFTACTNCMFYKPRRFNEVFVHGCAALQDERDFILLNKGKFTVQAFVKTLGVSKSFVYVAIKCQVN